MKGRTAVRAFVVVMVILFATFGTVRARQVLTENQARGRLDASARSALSALRHAQDVGITRPVLAPYSARLNAIRVARPPSDTPLWSPNGANFYDNQARAYRSLASNVDAVVRLTIDQTRATASDNIGRLSDEVAHVRSFDGDTSVALSALQHFRAVMRSSRNPTQFRDIALRADKAYHDLASEARSTDAYVNSMLAANNHDSSMIAASAKRQIDAVGGQLDLLALFAPRAAGYRVTLAREFAAVQSASTPVTAAVKSAHIHSDLAVIEADYTKTVPAKVILVSTERQFITLFENGKQIYTSPVTTGGPELPTDHGVFHIYEKASPFTFHSPWPPGSPYYYAPTDVQFWMPFYEAEGLHDASWRSNFGPGSNFAPTDLGTGNTILGTHGCVNLPFSTAQFIWDWAPVGTAVVVV